MYDQALQIINDKISNVHEKVDCLKLYGPKLLKDSNEFSQTILQMTKVITHALMNYHKKTPNEFSGEFSQYWLYKNQALPTLENIL